MGQPCDIKTLKPGWEMQDVAHSSRRNNAVAVKAALDALT